MRASAPEPHERAAIVPGRATLIGEHTDYTGGLALAFALPLAVTARATPRDEEELEVLADGFGHWRASTPPGEEWSRQAAAVVATLRSVSQKVEVTSDLPAGAGLSSSAAYIGALCLALGAHGDLIELARLVQHCESVAGHNVGLLDPLTTLGACDGHGLLIDFSSLTCDHVAFPNDMGLTIVHTELTRHLATSDYGVRRAQCRDAAALIGPLRTATLDDVARLDDALLRRRARHVITENARVSDCVAALALGDLARVGANVAASHASLRDDFEVSRREIDELVDELAGHEGVLGVRLIGGGFGGCVLVVHHEDVSIDAGAHRRWRVRASDGALARNGRSTG